MNARKMIGMVAVMSIAGTAQAAAYAIPASGEGLGLVDFIAVQVVSGDNLAPPVFRSGDAPMPGWIQAASDTCAYATFAPFDTGDSSSP